MKEKTVTELLHLWNAEKENYKTAEIGSGVQRFVKQIFESDHIFNLTEGKLSTPDIHRKNEFLTEAKKKGRRADTVIFIDQDIIIPVEVEKYGHIKSGIQQIFNYQGDWTKKYGLLTDGNEWRFYNNRFVEKSFFIEEILKNPTDFLTFWQEYTTPNHYYQSFFEKKGQLSLFEEPAPNVDDVREDFFNDITRVIENFKNKLNLKGYFKEVEDETEKEKRAVEITYAYLIQFILYKVLVDNTFGDFEDDWKQRIESIANSIKAKTYGDALQKIKAISDKISDKIYKRFNDEQEVINRKLHEILSAPKTEITDVSVWLDILLFINRYNFANVQNEIFGYVYENYLKDLYTDEKKGQYFTDPNVVEFMLNEIGYNQKELKQRYQNDKESISIIDPSCGSGTFLYNATNRIVDAFFDGTENSSKIAEKLINDNIFGLDIAEFPLYLAEMNILMRMLKLIVNERYNNPIDQKIKVFKTKDSIAEFLDTEMSNTETDLQKNAGQLSLFQDFLDLGYDSFMRDKNDLENLKKSLEKRNQKPRTRFDFVIGNPPYISYNECAKQKVGIIQFIQKREKNMNNIFGMNLNSVPGNLKSYPPKPNLYAFFIALGIGLLKDEGKLSYIIPQTILTANDLDVLRYHLSKFTTIEKIITFSGKMFLGRGIKQNKPVATSSLIFILNKKIPQNNNVEIINYLQKENNLDFSNLKSSDNWEKITKSFVKQSLLYENFENWNFVTQENLILEFIEKYKSNSESFDVYRLFENSVPRYKDKFYFDVGFILDDKNILAEKKNDEYEILDFKNFIGYSNFKATKFYPKNNQLIELTRSNQGFITLEPQYSIVWRIKNTTGFKLTNRPIIFKMGTASIITSNSKFEMLYLLSLLNSSVSKVILESYLKIPTEKEYLLAILPIKKYIKVPKITPKNQFIKDEVIVKTQEMLDLEHIVLEDLVDFRTVMMQKFDKAEIKKDSLILHYAGKEISCKIKSDLQSVENCIATHFHTKLFNESIALQDLKKHSAFDQEKQNTIKNYIDDLVFALYFNVEIKNIGIENAEKIKQECQKNKFYTLINS